MHNKAPKLSSDTSSLDKRHSNFWTVVLKIPVNWKQISVTVLPKQQFDKKHSTMKKFAFLIFISCLRSVIRINTRDSKAARFKHFVKFWHQIFYSLRNEPAMSHCSAKQIIENARRFSRSLDSILQSIARSFANTPIISVAAQILVT